MKSFKQFHQTQLIWKKLFEAADPKLVARVKKAIDEIEDNNLLNNVLETLFEPRLKTTVKELFDERGITRNQEDEISVFIRQLFKARASNEDRLLYVDEMLMGEAFDVQKWINDSMKGISNWKNRTYHISKIIENLIL